MPIKRNDRRKNRTRQALRDALQALILEKGYDSVTVEEITDRADLGRTTFYLHYRDKEDLLLESFAELVDDLLVQIAATPLPAWKAQSDEFREQPFAPIQAIFQHAAANSELYRLVLRGEGIHQITERLREFIYNGVQAFLRLKVEGDRLQMQVPGDVFANYLASALIGAVTWWLEAGLPYPPQAMAIHFQRLFIPGAQEVIDLGTG